MLLWQIIILVCFVISGVLTMYYCFGDSNNPFAHHFRNPTALKKLGRKCLCCRKTQQQTQSGPNVFVIATGNDNQPASHINEQLNSSLHLCDLPPSYDELFDKYREAQRHEKF